jgi:hypothetical protein
MRFSACEKGKSGVLYEGEAGATPTWGGYYLLNAAVPGGEPPATIELAESLSAYWGAPHVNGGCYVFLDRPPPAGSADALAAVLARLNAGSQGWAYRYLLWLTLPAAGHVALPAVLGSIPFAQHGFDSGSVIAPGMLTLRNLELAADVGLRVEIDTTDASIVLGRAGTAELHLMQRRDTPKQVGQVNGGATIALAGAQTGGVGIDMELNVYAPNVSNDFATLGVGVTYLYTQAKVVKSQLFPILGVPQSDTKLPFSVRLDPLNPTTESRTRFTFADERSGAFATSLRTASGIPLTLTPLATGTGSDAGLTLAPDRVTRLDGTQIDAFYPTLAGDFTIAAGAAAPAGPVALLCGLSGLEAISVNPTDGNYDGDRLTFHPGQPAHASAFPPTAVTLEDPPPKAGFGAPLDGSFTTAWVAIGPGKGSQPVPNLYYSQPSGAPLFGGAAQLGFLPLVERATATAAGVFPLAAYTDISLAPGQDGFDPSLFAAFEQSVLSPARRATMTPLSAEVNARLGAGDGVGGSSSEGSSGGELATGDTATTPQGFLVTLGSGSSWASLLLGQTADGSTAQVGWFPPGANPQVDPRVQKALQTNQLFLVGTAAPWPAGDFHGSISVEGWPFELNVGQSQAFGQYANVMIMKFCPGTLCDLVADPRRWTDTEDFASKDTTELVSISEWLQGYIAAAAARAPDPAFAHFNALAADPDWRGTLFLRVTVPLAQLPAQVGALRAGLSSSTFYAHHLGIEASKIDSEGGLSMDGPSSLFGLIDYADPAYAAALQNGGSPDTPVAPTPGLTYDFKVLSLIVVFENSEVKDFRSKSQVTLNEWFGDAVLSTSLGSGGTVTNSIVIDGVLQHHDGQPVYSFSSSVDTVFELDSNVLSAVEVLGTTLATIEDRQSGPSTFRFAFGGYLRFAALPQLDAFSFAPPGGQASGGGLAYSSLFLDLVFDPTAATPRTFTFSPAKIAFDAALSNARPGSLFGALPLKLAAFVSGQSTPAQQGFLPVSLPGVALSSLPSSWYGLLLDFDLGSPGALAAEAGWTAGLLLAWGPGSKRASTSARAQMGMQLPGAGGNASMLSLQGILKLSIGQIQLRCLPGGVYLLQLTRIALHFLVFQFPPSGETMLYVFGDPASPGQRSQVGWFAAYNKPAESALLTAPAARRVGAGQEKAARVAEAPAAQREPSP